MANPFKHIIDGYDGSTTTDLGSMPPILYHYTNAAGVAGMLASHSIWLTHHQFLNDKTEIEHTGAVARNVLAAALAGATSDISRSFLSLVQGGGSLNTQYETYIFSLSDQSDDLSQWRGYASEGQGFTLGFSTKSLFRQKTVIGGCDLFKVEYDRQAQERVLLRAVNDIIEALELQAPTWPGGPDDLTEKAVAAFDLITFARSVSNKHSSFSVENEWRLSTFIDLTDETDLDEVKVRVRGPEFVKYTEVPLAEPAGPLKGKLPLVSIGIGPGFSRSNQRQAVQSLCRNHGYSPDIYNADTPYSRT